MPFHSSYGTSLLDEEALSRESVNQNHGRANGNDKTAQPQQQPGLHMSKVGLGCKMLLPSLHTGETLFNRRHVVHSLAD